MADEGERVGGIYVDVGVDDEGVIGRLNAIESALSRLAKQTVEIKVNYVEQGSTTPKRARGTKTTELPASLVLERDAAKKAAKKTDPVNVPVTLSLASDAISKLKAQITEGFQNFSIKVKVEYGGGTQAAQEEFAEATGLERGGRTRTKRVTRSTAPKSALRTPEQAIAEGTAALNDLLGKYDELKQKPGVSQRLLNSYSGEIARLRRGINVLQNSPREVAMARLNPPQESEVERERRPLKRDIRRAKPAVVRPVPAAVVEEERASVAPAVRPPAYVWPTTRAAERPAREPVSVPLPTSTPTGRQRRQAANDDPALAAIEAQQRREARSAAWLAGRGINARGGTRFGPREGPVQEFDRTPMVEVAGARGRLRPGVGPAVAFQGTLAGEGLVVRGPIPVTNEPGIRSRYARRRRGPQRTVAPGPDPSRGFFEPFARNRVTQVADENALGVLDPAAFAVLEAFRKGEFGTTEEPMVSRLGDEGRPTGTPTRLTQAQRNRINRAGERIRPGEVVLGGQYQIRSPLDLAKERLAGLGELSPLVKQRLFGTGATPGSAPESEIKGLFRDPRFRPGAGIGFGGGYVGASTGAGGAARSALDTPEGRAANRARIENDLYVEAFRRLEADQPDLAAAIRANTSTGLGYRVPAIRMRDAGGGAAVPMPRRVSEPRRRMLEPYLERTGGDIVEERALREQSPREFGFQPRLAAAFARYQSGGPEGTGFASRAGLGGYLGEDEQVTPATTYKRFVSKFLDQFKEEFGYRKSAKFRSLPEALQSQLGAYAAKIREDVGEFVPDYESFTATGGRGRRRVAGNFEAAAARAEPAGRATTVSTESRSVGSAEEQQYAELTARIERIAGARGLMGIERGRTPESRRRVASGIGVRVVEPGVVGQLQNQARALHWAQSESGNVPRFVAPTAAPAEAIAIPREGRRPYTRAALELAKRGKVTGQIGMTQSLGLMDELSALLRQREAIRPMAEAARDIDIARGADRTGAPTVTEKPPLTGDELAAKVAASPTLGRVASVGPAAPTRRRRTASQPGTEPTPMYGPAVPAGFEPTPVATAPTFIEEMRIRRGETPESQGQLAAFPEMRAQRAAEESAPSIAPPPGEGPPPPPTTLAGGATSGGAVLVRVVNFAELKGMGLTGKAKASEEREPKPLVGDTDPEKIKAAAAEIRAKLPKITDKDLSKRIVGRGFEAMAVEETLGLATGPAGRAKTLRRTLAEAEAANPGLQFERPDRDPNVKSQARINAEVEILQARSLNPTRAFQTAVAAGFAKTIGGGGRFEERVRQLTNALNVQANFEEKLEGINKELGINEINLKRNNEAAAKAEAMPAGAARSEALRTAQAAGTTLEARQVELRREAEEVQPSIEEARTETARRRRALISPVGVARGFAALGAGAITGGLIYGAASQAINAALGTLEEQAVKAADALGGFTITAAKVAQELASAVKASFGATQGAVAGAAAPTGISAEALTGLNAQGLSNRAEAIAAAQTRVQESDLFRTANFLGGDRLRGGYDRALFQGTGGILNTQLFAPQPGFMERIADDLKLSAPPVDYGPVQLPPGPEGGVGRIVGRNTEAARQYLETLPKPETPEATTRYVADLNTQLDRANSGFRYLTDATDEQTAAMVESAKSLGQEDIAAKLVAAGVTIVGKGGKELTGTEFGQAAADLSRGQLMVDPRVAFEADKRQLEAQIHQIERELRYEISTTIPRTQALQRLAAPSMDVLEGQVQPTGLVVQEGAGGAAEQDLINKGIQAAQINQDKLNQQYAAGEKILRQQLADASGSDQLFQDIKTTGAEIARIQADIADAQGHLQTREYNNQLRIAKRTVQDIAGLSGKTSEYGKSQLGILERENVMLSRQSELLGQMLQQRQINFQLAVAGFQVAGQSPEERAARMKDAKTQAEFAQKQLDIQKKMFGVNVKLFDEQNIRAMTDALASIGLLEEGREVNFKTTLAEKNLARLNKIQEKNLQNAGAYLGSVDKGVQLAYAELYKLEAAYGKAIMDIAVDTVDWFTVAINKMYRIMNGVNYGGGTGGTGPTSRSGYANNERINASGYLGTVSGATSMIMGEAGTETVAILRNPRNVTPTTSGGGSVTININNPVVREENDITKITRSVINAINTRTALLGLR